MARSSRAGDKKAPPKRGQVPRRLELGISALGLAVFRGE